MKIAIAGAATDPAWGGGEPRVAQHLIEGLGASGDDVANIPSTRGLVQILGLASTPWGWDPASVSLYTRRLAEHRPDVVLGFYDYDASLLVAAGKLGIPFVGSVHIYWPVCPIGTLYIEGKGICDGPAFGKCLRHMNSNTPPTRLRLLKVRHLPPPVGAHLYAKFRGTERLMKAAKRIVTPGTRIRDELISRGFTNAVTIRVGIPIKEIPPGDWNAGQRTVLMNTGSPIERKGIDQFRYLASKLAPRWPEVVFRATSFAGDAHVAATPYLSRTELVQLIRTSFVSVLPALWMEPFPVAAIEAMAAAKPVVTYDTGGLSEIVKDGVTGILVPLGDVDRLVGAVESLLRDEAKARRMGEAGRKLVETELSSEIMIGAYSKLLHEVGRKA